MPILPFGDRPVVIVAGGPSVTLRQIRTIGMARSQDRCRVIAINDAVYPCWFADIAYGCDAQWWRRHDGVRRYPGLKISLEQSAFRDVRALTNTGIEGYDDDVGCLRSGSNSGYQALHLSAKLGARKILLVGYDYSGEKHAGDGAIEHWFGRHGPGFDKNSDTQEWRRLLRGLTDHLGGRGIEILNCSQASTIQWLQMATIDEQFEGV